MKYIIAIALVVLLTACTTQITAVPKESDAVPGTLEAIPEERIPISPISTGEQVKKQQLKACAERDVLVEEIKPLKFKQSELFALAKEPRNRNNGTGILHGLRAPSSTRGATRTIMNAAHRGSPAGSPSAYFP